MIIFMNYFIYLLTVLALLVSNAHGLSVRDTTSDIASTKGGILVKNGKQTSCELGVINSKAAFVAAYCIDFSGKTVNQNTEYEVYLDAGIDNTPAKYSVESITVHPGFNATTGLNPVAVIQFNKDSTETWSNPIAIDRNNSWGDVLFIRRGMTSLNKMQWKTPLTATNKYIDAADCNSDNRIFETNEYDLFCSNATTYSPYAYLTGCAIPYGSVDVYISGKLYVAGIHGFTSISFSSYSCTLRDFQDSMYVLFSDYIAFANKVLESTISYYPDSNDISPQSNSGYSMKMPDYLLSGRIILGGDFYANQTASTFDDNSSSSTKSAEQSRSLTEPNSEGWNSDEASSISNSLHDSVDADSISETSSSTPKDSDEVFGDNQNASSKKTVIIGVVCGVLGGIILTCLFLFFYRRWKKGRKDIYRDNESRNDMHTMLVVDGNNFSLPLTVHTPAALTPKPSMVPLGRAHGGDPFEVLDYDLPPLYEPKGHSAPTKMSQ